MLISQDRSRKDPRTLTVVEAADILGISRSTAYELVRQGRIPSVRLGRRIVIPLTSLLRMLEQPQAESA